VAVSRQTQLQNQLSTLNSDIAEASAAPVDPGVILRPAPLISSPSSPVALICFVAGALLGLLVGVALAVLLERRDTRLRDEDDFESLTPVPVLVRVPAGRSALAPALVDPDSAIGDAYRQLRTGLLAGNTENPPHVLTVASCAPATDSGPVAVNLAAALHRAGFRTVLVSAHMRGSSVAELLQLSSDPGLGDVLRGVKPLREIVQYSPYIAGLPIIVGRKGDGAIDMLQNGRMAELVTALRSSFDMVLLEAAPVLTGGDARDIAVLGDGLLLVAEPNQTHRDEVATSVRRLRLVNAPLTGLVLVDEPQPRGRSSAAAPAIDSSPTPVLSTPTEA
jgi:receptor protein-tyrosine kinase